MRAPVRCPSALRDLAERLGHRRGLGQFLLRAAQIRQQVQHPLPLGGQVLPLTAQVRDQPVEFGEPGAAPAGPGGRPDVLRGGLGPGAQLQPVAVLRPGCHHGGTARTGPGRLPRTGRPVPRVHFVRNENRPQYCLHHGRRDQVLIFGDEHVGQGPPGGPRRGRDGQQVPVGLGRRDRGRGQRRVGMDPGGQHARPVQRAFYPGGVLAREPVSEPDQLPERRARTSRRGRRAAGRRRAGRRRAGWRSCAVPRSGPPASPASWASALVSCSRRLISVSVRGWVSAVNVSVSVAASGSPARPRATVSVSRPDSSRIAEGWSPAHRAAQSAQLPGHFRAGGGQSLLRVPAGLVAVVEGLPGLAQFRLGELAGLLGLLHGGEPAADLGDVVAAGGDPGLGRHGQVGAGVRGLAVAEQARTGRRLGQRLQVPAEGAAQLVAVAGHGVGLLLQAVDVGPGLG